MTAKTASLHAKVAAGPMKQIGSALEAKLPGMRKAKMVEALMLKALVVVRQQMWPNWRKTMMRKLKEPAAKLKSKTLRAVPALGI